RPRARRQGPEDVEVEGHRRRPPRRDRRVRRRRPALRPQPRLDRRPGRALGRPPGRDGTQLRHEAVERGPVRDATGGRGRSGAANRAAYDFVWSEFCDWYLEAAKAPLREGDPHTLRTVRHALDVVLRLLHPFVPFVTSELYAALGHEEQVALAPWPEADEGLLDPESAAAFERVQAAVTAARGLRAEAELPPSQTVDVWVAGPGAAALAAQRGLFEPLARATLQEGTPAGSALVGALPDAELRLPLAGQVDVAAYAARQRAR